MSGMLRPNVYIVFVNTILDILSHPREIEVARHLLERLLDSLVPTGALSFVVYPENFSSSTCGDINPFLKG